MPGQLKLVSWLTYDPLVLNYQILIFSLSDQIIFLFCLEMVKNGLNETGSLAINHPQETHSPTRQPLTFD